MKIRSASSIIRPERIVIYGVPGIGKTTWASRFPDPLIFDLNRGITDSLELGNVKVVDPQDNIWELMNDIKSLKPSDCKTIIIDTTSDLEVLMTQSICDSNGWQTLKDKGGSYGRGDRILRALFDSFIATIDKKQEEGFGVVLVGHAEITKFSDPRGQIYDRYQLQMSQVLAQKVYAKFDDVLFASFEDTAVGTGESFERKKGQTGERIIYTQHDAAWMAKNRLGLPPKIGMDYKEFEMYIHEKPKMSRRAVIIERCAAFFKVKKFSKDDIKSFFMEAFNVEKFDDIKEESYDTLEEMIK